jgi:hypothetical protein
MILAVATTAVMIVIAVIIVHLSSRPGSRW